jgi:hypothetical protein
VRDVLMEKVAPILEKSADVAVNMGRDGFQDRKMILQMGGWFQEQGNRTTINIGAKKMVVGIVGISPEDLLADEE